MIIERNEIPISSNVESRFLEQALDLKNFSTSYKVLWFNAILDEVLKGNKEIKMKLIISKMVAYAWYPTIYYKLSLGFQDQLSKIINYVNSTLGLKREEKIDKIEEFIFNSKDKYLIKMLNDIRNFVPYRLIRPFFEDSIKKEERNLNRKLKNSEINKLIAELSNKSDDVLYKIDSKNKKISVNDNWCEYLINNQAIIQGWVKYKITYYLQIKNPNVPAIPFKIQTPVRRDLSKGKLFWKVVGENIDIKDIYTGKVFDIDNINKYGEFSIDHYVPWSFVLHDELWKLVPTFKNVNSSKGNNIPNKNKYLNEFCELQYRAFLLAREDKKISNKILEDYFNINKDIYNIYTYSESGREFFIDSLKNTIEPLCQIAFNQGYGFWEY